MSWRDRTSYSRDERGTAEPRSWEVDIDGLRVIVHRWHGLEGWFGSCDAMGVERQQLRSSSAADAQHEFLAYLLKRCANWTKKLTALTKKAPTP